MTLHRTNCRQNIQHAWGAFVLVLALSGSCAASASDMIGAEGVIKAVLDYDKQQKKDPANSTSLELESLTEEAETLFEKLPGMPPDPAAKAWIDLLQKWWELDDKKGAALQDSPYARLSSERIYKNLPRPEAWPELQRLSLETTSSKSDKVHILQIITSKLTGDEAGTEKAVANFRTSLRRSQGTNKYVLDELDEIFAGKETSGSVVERFDRVIGLREKNNVSTAEITVPDFLAMTDRNKAKELLKRALLLPNTKLKFTPATETFRVAREVAVDNMQLLNKPLWEMAHALGSADLFKAMCGRFNIDIATGRALQDNDKDAGSAWLSSFGLSEHEVSNSNAEESLNDFNEAKAYYFLDLYLADRRDVADTVFNYDTMFISSLSSAANEVLAELPAEPLYAHLIERLDAVTTAPHKIWGLTQDLARLQNRLVDHTARLEAALPGYPVDDESLPELYEMLAKAYLELNEPDKAVSFLVKMGDLPVQDDSGYTDGPGEKLVRLGEVLDRPDLVNQGISQLDATLMKLSSKKGGSGYESYQFSNISDRLLLALIEEGRTTEAEIRVLDIMKQPIPEPQSISLRRQLLPRLLMIYHKAGRHDDIMRLLTDAPWWGAEDANQIENSRYGAIRDQFTPHIAIAHTLAAAGHKAEAIALLKQSVIKSPSFDPAYDALTSMTGESIIPWLDDLAAKDPFEERPLIWKAVVLQRAGQHDPAEAAARRAIAIDPTDGEQPKGSRLFGYSVLADILAANNKTSESETLKKVVAAVRLAEKGDELNELGLVEQAVDTYSSASLDFSDAYCVEWRLARRLQERGDEDAATLHYRKAFELMPNQFGRLSRLCFGCENIFATKKPQSIAEEILQRMASQPPVKATVYQLLGQLREEQGRLAEAAEYYKKATQTDPKYYDAWKKLYDISESAFISPQDRSAIATRLIELDWALSHFSVPSEVEISPAVLWQVGERGRKWQTELDKPVFKLEASSDFIKQKQMENKGNRSPESYMYRSFVRKEWSGPAEHLADQYWFRRLIGLESHSRI